MALLPLLILTIWIVSPSMGQWDTSVCNRTTENNKGHATPEIPRQYMTSVECNFGTYTVEAYEIYDQPGNRVALTMKKPHVTGTTQMIFNYDTDEFFAIFNDEKDPTCAIRNIKDSPFEFLYGYQGDDGKAKLLSPENVMKFTGEYQQEFVASERVRGIAVHHWRSCAYNKDNNATMNVDWYWSDPEYWTPAIDTLASVPVRCVVDGKIRTGADTSRPFKNTYEYVNFKPYIDPGHAGLFLTPKGVQCPGRISTKKIPNPPRNHFSMTIEEHQIDNKYVDTKKEMFDSKAKLFRIDYMPSPKSQSSYGMREITEVHDFNTGVAYVMDSVMGNCTAKKIPTADPDVMTLKNDSSKVRIRTVMEFFHMDKVKYTYEGQRMVRGVMCDVYIAQRDDFPTKLPGFTIKSTFEWYFATNDYDFGETNKVEKQVPMRLRITTPGFPFNYVYEIFDYDTDEPSIFSYDVSQCYTSDKKRHLEFALPGSFNSVVRPGTAVFKYSVLISLQESMGVSPIRISQLQIESDAVNIIVTFTLLERSPIESDVAEAPIKLSVTLLNKTINQGAFEVKVQHDDMEAPMLIKAKANSLKSVIKEIVPVTKYIGYSRGMMALCAVMTIIGGFAVGVVVVFVLHKTRKLPGSTNDSAFEPQTFQNQPM